MFQVFFLFFLEANRFLYPLYISENYGRLEKLPLSVAVGFKSQKRAHVQCGGPFKAVQQQQKKRVVTTVAKGCERARKKQKATEMKEQRRKKGQLIIINVFIFFVQRACEFALCSFCCMYIYFLSLFFFLSFTFCCCCCGCCCPGRKLTNIKTRN